MSKEKRYWWLKLPEDFFRSKEIRYLKRRTNGYRLVYIYLGMMLESLKTGGVLSFEGMGESPEEEIAVMLGEDVRHVIAVVEFLKKYNLLFERTEAEYFMPFVEDHTGSEGATAQRMRELRARNDVAQNRSQCDTNLVTLLQENVTPSTQCDTNPVTSLRRDRVRDREELAQNPSFDEGQTKGQSKGQMSADCPAHIEIELNTEIELEKKKGHAHEENGKPHIRTAADLFNQED